jgi:extracellular elastinolytic metalloproteinase
VDLPAAVQSAARHLGLAIGERPRLLSEPEGIAREATVARRGLSRRPIRGRLMWLPIRAGLVRLVWNFEIHTPDEQHDYEMTVDAGDGKVWTRFDQVSSDSYRVYAQPAESPNHATPLPPSDGRTLVANPADATASPFGWHDTSGAAGAEFTTTQGNNAHAYTDVDNNNSPDAGSSPSGGGGLTFDFALNLTLAPSAYRPAAVTNLFYWNNIIHDVFYRYGFDEVSGNFQTNQYGHGGLGNDSVQAEAQDGSGVNNANFATPVDGGRPRMQMYVWPNTGQRRIIDGDLDSGVITHEYAHGISNRLTGGPGTNCLSGEERMGEGWSDWLAIALTALPTDSGEARRGMGTYVLGQPNRQGAGIRPTPYSTNMQTNPATYNTIRSSAVPHGVGYVWATMLWEVYWNLVGEHGFNPDVYGDWTTGGNNLAIQLVMDGMKFQPCAPGFEDGRDAILAANAALTEGEDETVNHCLIWAAFAKRGLGWSADQGQSSSRTDGTEAFDLPPECET